MPIEGQFSVGVDIGHRHHGDDGAIVVATDFCPPSFAAARTQPPALNRLLMNNHAQPPEALLIRGRQPARSLRQRIVGSPCHCVPMAQVTLDLGTAAAPDLVVDVLTFDGPHVVLWSQGTEVGRFAMSAISAIQLDYQHPDSHTAPSYSIASIRAEHPAAYERWSEDEEDLLRRRTSEGASVPTLCAELGRQPGGVKSRLLKLGLKAPSE